jgi:hypothetical protein
VKPQGHFVRRFSQAADARPCFVAFQRLERTSNRDAFLAVSEPLTVNPGDVAAPFTITPSGAPGDPGDWVVPPGATKVFFVRYWPMEDGTHIAEWTLADDPQGRVTQLSGLVYSGHQNPLNPYDMNGDGYVIPQDVLLLINEINRGGDGPLSPRTAEEPGPPWFVDVTNSGTLVPNDVLQVINYLNRGDRECAEFTSRIAAASRSTSQLVDGRRGRSGVLDDARPAELAAGTGDLAAAGRGRLAAGRLGTARLGDVIRRFGHGFGRPGRLFRRPGVRSAKG